MSLHLSRHLSLISCLVARLRLSFFCVQLSSYISLASIMKVNLVVVVVAVWALAMMAVCVSSMNSNESYLRETRSTARTRFEFVLTFATFSVNGVNHAYAQSQNMVWRYDTLMKRSA